MKIEHHIAISAAVSAITFMIFKSWGISTAAFLSGVLIDFDHVIDYVSEKGLCFDAKDFFSYFYKERHEKITLIFHGWEWLLSLAIASGLTNLNPWVTGALIGYGHHIVCDYYYSKASVLTYSLLWRWKHNFDSHILFPRDRGYDP